MVDVVSPEVRSRMMAGIKGKNTKPEMIIRQGLHLLGFRFRVHRNDLPGRPDLVLARYEAAVLVNGCFWHGHDCSLFKWPTSRTEFWKQKLEANRSRDKRNLVKLEALGWRHITIWECSLKGKRRMPPGKVLSICAEWLVGSQRTCDIREL